MKRILCRYQMRRVHKMTLLKSKLLLRRGLVKNVITQLFKWLLFHSTICFLKPAVQNVFLLKFACSLIGAVAAGSARLASRLAWEAMGGHRRQAVPPCHTAVPPPSSDLVPLDSRAGSRNQMRWRVSRTQHRGRAGHLCSLASDVTLSLKLGVTGLVKFITVENTPCGIKSF